MAALRKLACRHTPLHFLLFSSVLQGRACLVAGALTADRNVKGELEGMR